MNYGAGFYLLLITVILFFALVGLIGIINTNFRAGQRLRAALLERIKLLRLGRMLKRRGIDTATFLHEAGFHDIETNIRNCESCGKIKECDAVLEVSAAQSGDLSFCPNDKVLKKYSKRPPAGIEAPVQQERGPIFHAHK